MLNPEVLTLNPEAQATQLERLAKTWTHLLTPPPDVDLSTWSDNNIVLGYSSPEPGPWRSDRAGYLKGILDVAGNPRTRRLVVQGAAQCGKTSVLLNLVALHMKAFPCPIMITQPDKSSADMFSTQKLDVMLNDSPNLRGLVADRNKRDGNNTKSMKSFPGGFVRLISAKSVASMRQVSIQLLCMDEVDAYDAVLGDEGDPIKLMEARTTNYVTQGTSKIVLMSTPTLEGFSRIEDELKASTWREYWVPCPHCKEHQVLEFGGRDTPYGLKWERNAKGEHDPATAFYQCKHCASVITHDYKMWMTSPDRGQWRARNPDHATEGFHISALYSPWVTWEAMAKEWLSVCKIPDKIASFFNLKLGLPYLDKANKLDTSDLASHVHDYDAACPSGVGLITAGVDVQHDWLEVGVWGWGVGEEAFQLDSAQFVGNTSQQAVWDELAEFLRTQTYANVKGVKVPIAVALVDSGDGQRMDTVLRQVQAMQRQGIKCHPIKGLDGGRMAFEWSRNKRAGRPMVGNVGSSGIKALLYDRMRNVVLHGPGYVHFATGTPIAVLEQITSERRVMIYGEAGGPRVMWKKRSEGSRNEQLDCFVYSYAALQIDRNIETTLKTLVTAMADKENPEPQAANIAELPDVTHIRPVQKRRQLNINPPKRQRFKW